MASAIPLVQEAIVNLVNSGSQIPKWILTEFKGRHELEDGSRVNLVTKDPEELKRAVRSLQINGGQSIGEEALKGERWGGGICCTGFGG